MSNFKRREDTVFEEAVRSAIETTSNPGKGTREDSNSLFSRALIDAAADGARQKFNALDFSQSYSSPSLFQSAYNSKSVSPFETKTSPYDRLRDRVATIFSTEFETRITKTTEVPAVDDNSLTFADESKRKVNCKTIETCVLYIDIRDSSKISAAYDPESLTRLYSVFANTIVAAADEYGGVVRNIIGDRVMVLFHSEECFSNAVDTAIHFNSIVQNVISPQFPEFRCGIGVDFGQMFVTKVGKIRRGAEAESYRGLTWLGNPANVASKLTDLANKQLQVKTNVTYVVDDRETGQMRRGESAPLDFVRMLQTLFSLVPMRNESSIVLFSVDPPPTLINYEPILVTRRVWEGLRQEKPDHSSIQNRYWKRHQIEIEDSNVVVYGLDVTFAESGGA